MPAGRSVAPLGHFDTLPGTGGALGITLGGTELVRVKMKGFHAFSTDGSSRVDAHLVATTHRVKTDPMQHRHAIAIVGLTGVLVACAQEMDDGPDRNRPETYGQQCEDATDCAEPFQCLGTRAVGSYYPICSMKCTSPEDCPQWNATGYCAGPIRPLCESNICDYARCR